MQDRIFLENDFPKVERKKKNMTVTYAQNICDTEILFFCN